MSEAEHLAFSPTHADELNEAVVALFQGTCCDAWCVSCAHVCVVLVRAEKVSTRQHATVLQHSSCAYKRSAAKGELEERKEAGDGEAATYLARRK